MLMEGILMKKQLWVIPVFLFSFCITEGGFCIAAARTVDRILAKVNDDIITLSELNRIMESARKELSAKYAGAALEREIQKAEKQALDYLIEDKLLYQKAVEMDFHTRAEPKVAAYIQQVIKDKKLKDDEELDELLRKQGSSLSEFREEAQRQISIDDLKNDFVGSRISLLYPEILKYYKDHIADYTNSEEAGLSEIVIPVVDGNQEAENRSNELYRRLQQGESFVALANQYSKGLTAPKGGDIGTYIVGKLSSEIAKAIANCKEGEATKPQLMKEGYVIFRVNSRKAATVRPLSEVLEEVRQKLGNEKFEPEYERFITQLKEDAYIEYFSDIK
jgi:peptidyl-prolyl cis-trans isomerase SurA